MTKKQTDQTKPTRARHAKSRYGCLTCKIRRIRCDETRPLCQNCTSTRRKCEGVKEEAFTFVHTRQASKITTSSHSSSSRSNSSSPNDPSATILTPIWSDAHSSVELRSFDFFVKRTAPLFAAGALNAPFWRRLVPQVCHSDAVVWNCVIAIAALMEHPIARTHVVYRAGTDRVTKPEQVQALVWYSKAIAGLKERIRSLDATPSALLTSVLFACLEMQQGNSANALSLVDHGVKLFAEYLRVQPADRPPGYRILDEVVIPFFSQHAILLATFNIPLLSQAAQVGDISPDAAPTYMTGLPPSIEDLRQELYRLMFLAYEIIRGAQLIIEDVQELDLFKPRQLSLLEGLEEWRALYNHTISRGKILDEPISMALAAHYHSTFIWVAICMDPSETEADQFFERFGVLVDLAEAYLRSSSVENTEIGELWPEIIPSLYFTVTKCRDLAIRCRALQLLRILPKRKTIWETFPIVQILERLIEFEHSAVTIGDSVPARHDRVHHVQLVRSSGADRLAAKFVTFSSDGMAGRTLRYSIVPLEDDMEKLNIDPCGSFGHCTSLINNELSMRLAMAPEVLKSRVDVPILIAGFKDDSHCFV